MKRVNWHGVAAVVALFVVWYYWLTRLNCEQHLGWTAAIVSVIYGTIVIVNAARLPDDVDADTRSRKVITRNAGSIGGHLFLLLVIFLNWSHVTTRPLPDKIRWNDHLILSVLAALMIGMMIPFMLIIRDLPSSKKQR